MLSKCANSECSAIFLYLHQGRLFKLETNVNPNSGSAPTDNFQTKKSGRKLEYFWLCEKCCQDLTLTYDRAAGVGTRRTLNPLAAAVSAS
jgi:hypothetical protein